ncbi:hypothetical protein DL770_002663 [Monosporascus sp. CRB-9-2]|nr:hypothetical protein DL770_002663 [Monosporascus sp. CRB-9-2]
MKFSAVAQILSGAVAVSAAAVRPGALVPFTDTFETMTLEEAQAKAANDPGFRAMQAMLANDEAEANMTANGLAGRAEVEDRGPGCTNPAIRREWRNMSPADRRSFVTAIRCLMDKPTTGIAPPARNRYEELVWVHQQMTANVHMAGSFLPWHRYYVHTFSRLLRNECGYRAPFPWWDETRDAGNFAASGLFTSEYFGSLPQAVNGQGTCINDGAFAGKLLHIGPGSSNVERCLSRGERRDLTAQVNTNFVNTCNSRTAYAAMRECSEYGPHAYGHNGIGPVMAEVAGSPGDPVFFMHHAFVDRMWKVWQNQAQWRWTTISGCAAPGQNGQPCPPLTLDTVLTTHGIRPDVRVRDILDTEAAFLCYKYDY